MSFVKSLSAVVVLGAAASAATAGITPSWRVNPISAAAIAADPRLDGAISVSLLVDLSGASLFNVAGMTITQADLPGAEIIQVNTLFGPNDFRPTAALIGFAPAVEFDTYVHTTSATQNPAIPGPYTATGAAVLQSSTAFDVAWGATPGTGPLNGQGLEIARLTFRNVVPGFTPVRGEVRAEDATGVAVPLPPIPVAVPEPTTLGLAALGLGLISLRRR